MAVRSSEDSALGLVYFISLVGSDRFGVPEKHKFIFDLLSKEYDFNGTDVNYIDAQDLWFFFKKHNPNAVRSNYNVLQLSEYFIEMHPNSSFILDEVPSPKGHDRINSKKISMWSYKIKNE